MTTDSAKPKHRPDKPGIPVTVRLQPDVIQFLDAFIKAEPKPMTRPEAIRALILLAKVVPRG
jgi:hypothetical protein